MDILERDVLVRECFGIDPRIFGILSGMFILTGIYVWKKCLVLIDLRMIHVSLWRLYKDRGLFGEEPCFKWCEFC